MKETNDPIRIFLLDDHRLFSQVVKSLFDQLSEFEVVGQAHSMRDGILMIGQLQPHIVLMDYHLPDGNGIEASKTITRKFPRIDIIFMTMEHDYDIMMAALANGAKGYLLKDTGKEKLLDAIDSIRKGTIVVSNSIKQRALMPSYQKLNILSKREKEIALLITKGLQSSQIAIELHISEHTVTTHRKNIMRKMNVHNSMQLAKIIK
jgi:DNA-binding NarL/FixJ family response regulator